MATLLAHIRVRPGQEQRFEQIAQELHDATHACERDVRRYEYWRGAEPGTYYTLESFDEFAGFLSHEASPHHVAALPALREVLQEVRLEWVDPLVGASPLNPTDLTPRPDAIDVTAADRERYGAQVQKWWLPLRAAADGGQPDSAQRQRAQPSQGKGETMRALITGRRAIVTGAAQGLGLACAHALAKAGADVAVCDINSAIEGVAADLAAYGGTAWAAVADVSRPDDVRYFVDGASHRLGGIDTVVNNAGVCVPTSPVSDPWDKAVADYDWTLGANLRSAYLIGRAAIPYLMRQGGDIVNVTTDHIHTCGWPVALDHDDAPTCPWAASPRPPGGGAAFDVYDASKWGLNGLTQAWAKALRPHGVRVNSFGMGATDTPMYRGFLGGRPPAPGVMDAADVAAVLLDLLAEGAQGRTGDSIQLWVGHSCELPPVATHPAVV